MGQSLHNAVVVGFVCVGILIIMNMQYTKAFGMIGHAEIVIPIMRVLISYIKEKIKIN